MFFVRSKYVKKKNIQKIVTPGKKGEKIAKKKGNSSFFIEESNGVNREFVSSRTNEREAKMREAPFFYFFPYRLDAQVAHLFIFFFSPILCCIYNTEELPGGAV